MLSTFFQILIPLLIAALIGFLTGRWWTKRWYEDVTESYESLQIKSRSEEPKDLLTKDDLDTRIASLSSSVASIPRTDLDPVTKRLAKLESALDGLSFPETDLTPVYERMTRIDQRLAQPNEDFEKIDERLASLEAAISSVSGDVSALQNTDIEPLQIRFNRLEQTLGAIGSDVPEIDLGPIVSNLTQLENAVSEIDLPQTDISPLQEQLTSLELRVVDLAEAIEESRGDELESIKTEFGNLTTSMTSIEQGFGNISIPEPDLSHVEARLAVLEKSIGNIRLPETDLSPIYSRFERIEQMLSEPNADYAKLFNYLASLEGAVDALKDRKDVDLSPVHERVAALENLIAALRADVRGIPSLAPVERQLLSLQQSIAAMPQPDFTPVVASMRAVESRIDMAAMENRLTAIEYGLTAVHHMLRSNQNAPAPISQIEPELYADSAHSQTTTQTLTARAEPQTATVTTQTYTVSTGGDPIASARRPGDKSNLLQSAAFGESDDLERISGVGPMLSDLLKSVGVYYFWQVAEWDADDIEWVDGKLEHFKGRIERDNWVGQAREFAAEPGTANRPG